MKILDENIPEADRQLLSVWGIRTKHIGRDIGQQGMKDEGQIIPMLHSLRQAVLFTLDLGFCRKKLCHKKYCIVCLAVGAREIASSIQRFLRHPAFMTKAKRTGKVARVSERGIRWWQAGVEKEVAVRWEE